MYEGYHRVAIVNDQGSKRWENLRHQQYSTIHNTQPDMCVSPQGESGGAVLGALLAHPGGVTEESSHACGLNGGCGGHSGAQGRGNCALEGREREVQS